MPRQRPRTTGLLNLYNRASKRSQNEFRTLINEIEAERYHVSWANRTPDKPSPRRRRFDDVFAHIIGTMTSCDDMSPPSLTPEERADYMAALKGAQRAVGSLARKIREGGS